MTFKTVQFQQGWWHRLTIAAASRRLRQEEYQEFKACLDLHRSFKDSRNYRVKLSQVNKQPIK